jgi:4-hydroxy-3-polyprenylbenzoate decarboxylase
VAYESLREWIKALEKADQLVRVKDEVSPYLEMAEIADRAVKSGKGTTQAGGPALLFENVKGHKGARVLMNQFGSLHRMEMALETESLDSNAARIQTLIQPVAPTGLLDKLKMLPKLAEIGNVFPKIVSAKDAPCKEVILRGDGIDLTKFPIVTTWPEDGGPFLTLPNVITKDPNSGKRNVGMYRMQVYDGQTTGMHWQRQKNAAEHLRERLRNAAGTKEGAVDLMALTAGGTVSAVLPTSQNRDMGHPAGTERLLLCGVTVSVAGESY